VWSNTVLLTILLSTLPASLAASCGALHTGAGSFYGNHGSKSIVTQDVDGISGNSFSVCLYVNRHRMGALEYLLTMGAGTTRGALAMYFYPGK
jgi:hypothetical protein